jgi:hypothetical protein
LLFEFLRDRSLVAEVSADLHEDHFPNCDLDIILILQDHVSSIMNTEIQFIRIAITIAGVSIAREHFAGGG